MTAEPNVAPAAAEEPVAPEPDVESLSEDQLDTLFEQQANEPEPVAPAPPETQDPVAAQPGEGGEAPAAPEEPKTEGEAGSEQVPLGALLEERAQRKELKAQMDKMEGRFQQMVESLKPSPEVPAPPPDIPTLEENPVGNIDTRLGQLEQGVQQQQQQNAYQEKAQGEQTEWNQVMTAYHNDTGRLRTTDANAKPAYDYWVGSRMTELQAGGATPEQAQNILQQEEAAAVYRALQQGESPAERVYAIAKARGYQATPAADPATPAAPLAPGGPDPAVIAKGQAQGGGMPTGGSPPLADTLEALAGMDDADFDENWGRIVNKYH